MKNVANIGRFRKRIGNIYSSVTPSIICISQAVCLVAVEARERGGKIQFAHSHIVTPI